jgi:hypothetical protein
MEAHRRRRTRDQARKKWYAHYRQVRFARWLGFFGDSDSVDKRLVDSSSIVLTVAQTGGFSENQMNAPCTSQNGIPKYANPKIHVVLSDDLFSRLSRVAQKTDIPLRWLVAGLICDTLETTSEMSSTDHTRAVLTGRQPAHLLQRELRPAATAAALPPEEPPLEKPPSNLFHAVGHARQGFFEAFHEPTEALEPLARLGDPGCVLQPPSDPVVGHGKWLPRLTTMVTSIVRETCQEPR